MRRAFFCIFLLLATPLHTYPQHTPDSVSAVREAIKKMLPEGDMMAVVANGTPDQLEFSIGSDGRQIWFYAFSDSLAPPHLIERIFINLEHNRIRIGKAELTYDGAVHGQQKVHGETHRFQGYRWSSDPSTAGPDHKPCFHFALGRLEDSGQTLMHVQITETSSRGAVTFLDLPLLF